MRVHIVHAHPERQSFSASMFRAASDVLRSAGHRVEESDLYAMNFDPVASSDDFGRRANGEYLVYALEQRHGFKGGGLAADIQGEVEKLLAADLLILNFPIFWFSTPAMLKGWIDRVLLSGPCYGGLRFYDRGGLAGKKAWVTATLGGRPHMFGDNAVHGQLNDMLRHLLRGTLAYVGFDVLEPFYAYHVPYITAEARSDLLNEFRGALKTIETRPSLPTYSLDDFDERLHPLPDGGRNNVART
jgi:NAD(P)H dehydrogenase (quinone)